MWRGLAAGIAFGVAGCAGAASIDTPISVIQAPGNTQIPLPAGEWTLLASTSASSGRVMGGGVDNQHSIEVEYGRVENGVLTALVYVNTSADAPPSGGYVTGLGCIHPASADYVYFNDVRGSSLNAIGCTLVIGNRVFARPSASSSELYRQAFDSAKAFGGIPRQTVAVNFAEAHGLRFMNYTIWFFPARAGVAVQPASWRADELDEPARRYVAGIVTWAQHFRGAVSLGTDSRL